MSGILSQQWMLINTENWYQKSGIVAVTSWLYVSEAFGTSSLDDFWNILEKWAGECYKQRLTGNSCGSSEDQNANKNADRKDYAHEISDGNRVLLGIVLEVMHVT
jgi:hypothetical protein